MSIDLRGIHVPVTTPFRKDGELDRPAFEHNVRAFIAAGLQGIVVGGSTGEAALVDEAERESLFEWARQHTPNDRLVIAGVGAESTRATLRLAERAAERGADAILVVAPHYYGGSAMTDAALRAHYLRVADEAPAPVILYNIPKYMHFRLSAPLVAELSNHENIIGIKDSTGEVDSLTGYLASQRDDFTVLTGNGTFLKTALDMGARGGIVAVANFAAGLTLAVWDACARRDDGTASMLQARLSPIARVIVGELGPAGIKAAMDMIALRGGSPRPPLLPLSRGEVDRVASLLRDAELPVAA